MGAEAPAGPSVLRIRLPRSAAVTVRRDGVPIHEERSEMLDVEIEEAGVYRLEARIDDRLWLLSNPVDLC
jgi:hypothetical protein